MNTNRSNSFSSTLIRCTTRLICVGAVAWFGLIVAHATGAMNSLFDSNSADAGPSTIATSIPEMLMPSSGYWSFTDTALSIRKIDCDDAALESQLEKLLAVDNASAAAGRDASHLVAIAQSNGATRSDCPAGVCWTFDHSNLRLRLVTSDSDNPALIAAAVAIRAAGQWQLTMLQPRQQRSDHLLPLPADASTICTRRTESGQLQMELVSTTGSSEHLLSQWEAGGWEIRQTPWGTADSFSYVCARGDLVVYAWSDSTADSRTIMLTASAGVVASGHRSLFNSNRQENNH